VNASLAFIEGAKPQGEIECALVMRMACTHSAAMSVLGANGHGRDAPFKASAAARLMRAYATQVKTLRRLRNGDTQVVRVEHVHVNEGGQALIGNLSN
jgi:metal-dependent amidase/aminoacylase/carboxypeptidase family protein